MCRYVANMFSSHCFSEKQCYNQLFYFEMSVPCQTVSTANLPNRHNLPSISTPLACQLAENKCFAVTDASKLTESDIADSTLRKKPQHPSVQYLSRDILNMDKSTQPLTV